MQTTGSTYKAHLTNLDRALLRQQLTLFFLFFRCVFNIKVYRYKIYFSFLGGKLRVWNYVRHTEEFRTCSSLFIRYTCVPNCRLVLNMCTVPLLFILYWSSLMWITNVLLLGLLLKDAPEDYTPDQKLTPFLVNVIFRL